MTVRSCPSRLPKASMMAFGGSAGWAYPATCGPSLLRLAALIGAPPPSAHSRPAGVRSALCAVSSEASDVKRSTARPTGAGLAGRAGSAARPTDRSGLRLSSGRGERAGPRHAQGTSHGPPCAGAVASYVSRALAALPTYDAGVGPGRAVRESGAARSGNGSVLDYRFIFGSVSGLHFFVRLGKRGSAGDLSRFREPSNGGAIWQRDPYHR